MEAKHKVTMGRWKPGIGVRVNIQKNEDGKFGKTEKVFLSDKEIKGMDAYRLLQYASEYANNGEFVNEDEMEEPLKVEMQEDANYERRYEVPEIETAGLPNPFQLLRKYWVYGAAFMVLFTVTTVRAGQDSNAEREARVEAERQAEITRLTNEVKQLRQERENNYSQCQQSCETQRGVYDAEVTLRKAQLEELSN